MDNSCRKSVTGARASFKTGLAVCVDDLEDKNWFVTIGQF